METEFAASQTKQWKTKNIYLGYIALRRVAGSKYFHPLFVLLREKYNDSNRLFGWFFCNTQSFEKKQLNR